MSIFGKKQPTTPAENAEAQRRGNQQRHAQDRRARQLADQYEARVQKKGKR